MAYTSRNSSYRTNPPDSPPPESVSSSSSIPPEPADPPPDIPPAPEDLSFKTGLDFIPFLHDDEDASSAPNPRKRKARDPKTERTRKPAERRARSPFQHDQPWMNHLDQSRPSSAIDMLHKEIKAFADYICPNDEEHTVRAMISEQIQKIAREIWRDARAHAFGSFGTKLYLPTGDIDIVLETNLISTDNPSRLTALRTLARRLSKAHVVFNNRVEVIKARVPIVKFTSMHGRVSVDVSINQTTGLGAVTVINKFLQNFPALRPLIMVAKLYLNQRGMHEVFKGGLGSYSAICLMISFLQMHPKVRLAEIDSSLNLGVLLVEFFELYGQHFNYNNVGISVVNGGTYYKKVERGWADLKQPYLLSVEDPCDTTNDVARGSYQIGRVRRSLAGAYVLLTTRLLQVQEQLMARNSGRYMDLHWSTRRDAQSILCAIIETTDQMSAARARLHEVYWAGHLHKSLGRSLPAPKKSQKSRNDNMEAGELSQSSDMSLSESEEGSATPKQRTINILHPLSEVQDQPIGTYQTVDDRPSSESEEDSRYTTRNRKPNQNKPTIEYIELESDSESDSDSDGARPARKKRPVLDPSLDLEASKIIDSTKSPSKSKTPNSRSSSKREYWASKAQLDTQ